MKKLIYYITPMLLLAACAGRPAIVEPTEPRIPGSDLYGPVRIVINTDSNRPCEEYAYRRYAPDGARLLEAQREIPGLDTIVWKLQRHRDGREREILDMISADSTRYHVRRTMTYDSIYHRLAGADVKYEIRRGDTILTTEIAVAYMYLQTDRHGNWIRRQRIVRDAAGGVTTADEQREIVYW